MNAAGEPDGSHLDDSRAAAVGVHLRGLHRRADEHCHRGTHRCAADNCDRPRRPLDCLPHWPVGRCLPEVPRAHLPDASRVLLFQQALLLRDGRLFVHWLPGGRHAGLDRGRGRRPLALCRRGLRPRHVPPAVHQLLPEPLRGCSQASVPGARRTSSNPTHQPKASHAVLPLTSPRPHTRSLFGRCPSRRRRRRRTQTGRPRRRRRRPRGSRRPSLRLRPRCRRRRRRRPP